MNQRLHLVYRLLEKVTIREMSALFLVVVVSVSYIPIPVLLGRLLKLLQQSNAILEELYNPILLLILIFALQTSGAYFARKILIRYIKTLVSNMRLRLLQAYINGRGIVQNENLASLQKKIFSDTELVDQFYNSLLTKILPALAITAVSVGLMLYINLALAMVAALLSIGAFTIGRYFKKRRDEALRQYHATLELFNKKVMFVLRFKQLISLQSTINTEIESVQENLNKLKNRGVNMVMGFSKASNIEEFTQSVVVVITLFAAFWLKSSEKIQPEEILMFFFVIYILRRQITTIASERQLFSEGLFAIETVNRLEKNLIDIVPNVSKALIKTEAGGIVEFNHVDFHYPHSPALLTDISFSLLPQKVNLIQGANGVGKSTLMHLILGHVNPISGSICVGGVDSNVLDIRDFRNKVSVVQQESDLFDGTIRDNLLYGVTASDSEIEEVLAITGLHQWLNQLPLQLNTSVSELRDTISGGQKQRLLIARALLKKPQLLIMDEPTNHLDVEFVTSLLHIIERVKVTITVLLISHDKALEAIADQKIRIYEGTVESILLAK